MISALTNAVLTSPILSATATLGFAHPQALWLAPLALLPFILPLLSRQGYPTLAALPPDALSDALTLALRLLGAVAIGATVIGLAGLHRLGQSVERLGQGAHIALLIDRSASMNDSFAGRQPSGAEEAKAAAARRLLMDFVASRPHDRFAVAAFSTSPLLALPLTESRDAVKAAIAAADRPGLAFTDVGRGLALALTLFDGRQADGAARAVILVSDGAAVISRQMNTALRAAFARRRTHLYWLFLRTAGGQGIFSPPTAGEDAPQAMPERRLHQFFESLKTPYRAFEVENAGALAEAIAEIGRLESHLLPYTERIPRQDLSWLAYAAAAAAAALLTLVKRLEARL